MLSSERCQAQVQHGVCANVEDTSTALRPKATTKLGTSALEHRNMQSCCGLCARCDVPLDIARCIHCFVLLYVSQLMLAVSGLGSGAQVLAPCLAHWWTTKNFRLSAPRVTQLLARQAKRLGGTSLDKSRPVLLTATTQASYKARSRRCGYSSKRIPLLSWSGSSRNVRSKANKIDGCGPQKAAKSACRRSYPINVP